MKTTNLRQKARLILAAAVGISTLTCPVVAMSSDDLGANGRDGYVTVALASTRAYVADADHQAGLRASSMEKRWQELQQAIRPDVLMKLSEAFAREFPDSKYSEADRSIQEGARRAFDAVRQARLSADALEEATGDVRYRNELTQALRGDKESAHRIAMMYKDGANGLPRNERRAEQWLRIAAELGSGNASWQVAQIYNRAGLVGDAARFESKAMEAGYRLPVRLPTKARNI